MRAVIYTNAVIYADEGKLRPARADTWIKLAASLLMSLCAIQAYGAEAIHERRNLTPEDFYRIQDLSDPQVSPDGLWVAYAVTANDRESDEARSAIWMVSWDGTQKLALTPAAADTDKPRWSPDGRYLAYIATPAGSDKSQIMLLDRRGGDARQLTSVTGEIGAYAWAPDGKRLVFSMAQGDAGSAPKPIVIEAVHFKQDEDGYLGQGRTRHLYLLDVESKHSDPLTSDADFNEDLPAWSPDGRLIAFIRTHEPGVDQDGREAIAVIEPGFRLVRRRATSRIPTPRTFRNSPGAPTGR